MAVVSVPVIPPKPGPPMSLAEQLKYQQIANQLEAKQIDQLRDYAKTWAGTISALAGVSSVLTALSARDTLVKLPAVLQFVVGAVLLIGFAASVYAVKCAVRAQIGNLRPITNAPRDVQEYMDDEPPAIVKAIHESQVGTVVALISLVLSILFLWVGTVHPPSQAYLYPQAPDVLGCGVLTKDATTGTIALKPSGGVALVPITDTSKITKVDYCP